MKRSIRYRGSWRFLSGVVAVVLINVCFSAFPQAPRNENGGSVVDDHAGAVANTQSVRGQYLEIILTSRSSPGFIAPGRARAAPTVLDYTLALERARTDSRIRGVILNAASFNADAATLWELRSALESFKRSGKKVVAYFADGDLNLYCLLSVADRIVMDESGMLALLGYAYSRPYFLHTLEKLGIGVRELRYFTYKTAMESFSRDSLSPWDAEQYGAYLDDIYAHTRETILNARGMDEDAFESIINHAFLFSARRAQERSLVDSIGRKDAVIDAIAALEGGQVTNFSIFGNQSLSLMSNSRRKSQYSTGRTRNFLGMRPEIAVISARGNTDLERGMGALQISRLIQEVSAKSSVKAMVIRINSPGGSALAADYIAEAIRSANARVPVVASLGAVAASGGYWAAMYARHIVASPYSLTGSIGVISSWIYDQGFYDKTGVTLDVLKRGEHADVNSGFLLPARDLTAEEEAEYQQYIFDLYDTFVAKVANGRNRPYDEIAGLAQGRVYSGIAALEIGLVDSLGGLSEALELARSLAGLTGRRVIYREYPKPTLMESLLSRFMYGNRNQGLSQSSALASLFTEGWSGANAQWEDLHYRILRNGQAMPIMPLSALDFLGD